MKSARVCSRLDGKDPQTIVLKGIKRTGNCDMCGGKGVKTHFHHPDKSNPVLVRGLCTKCHQIKHATDRDIKKIVKGFFS